MELGVIGLPNVGKSTLFNALTNAGAESANYPFCTIEPNVGIVDVPDDRLTQLAKLYNSKKITPASLKFVDIAGLVKGASKGEGLGNKFLASIRECDAIVHVVRCFKDENITHVNGTIDPARDIDIINTELILSDLESLERQRGKFEKSAKAGDKEAGIQLKIIDKIIDVLNNGKLAKTIPFTEEENLFVKQLFLITNKPVIYACNIAEKSLSEDYENLPEVKIVKEIAQKEDSEVLVISAKVEQELTELPEEERQMFLDDLGLKESGLNRIIRLGYKLLGQISYLTAGEKEVRAWTILNGTKAPQAAGKIHSDFERGFIKAEVVDYNDIIKYGGFNGAKENGKVRVEGKDYVVKEGDVMLFKFNV
ncbi:MAG: redox-regulated ATPase YchF [Christensenellales bacterium]